MRRWQRAGTGRGGALGLLGLLLGAALAALPAAGAGAETGTLSPEGIWLTEDRDGGIEIYRCGDRLCGRLVWFADAAAPADPGRAPDPLCRYQLIGDLVQSDDRTWEDGWIRDPRFGLTYGATLTLESATTLRVRGYIGISLLGGTQLWTRAPAGLTPCAPESRHSGPP